jgi:hypothetical protein
MRAIRTLILATALSSLTLPGEASEVVALRCEGTGVYLLRGPDRGPIELTLVLDFGTSNVDGLPTPGGLALISSHDMASVTISGGFMDGDTAVFLDGRIDRVTGAAKFSAATMGASKKHFEFDVTCRNTGRVF